MIPSRDSPNGKNMEARNGSDGVYLERGLREGTPIIKKQEVFSLEQRRLREILRVLKTVLWKRKPWGRSLWEGRFSSFIRKDSRTIQVHKNSQNSK